MPSEKSHQCPPEILIQAKSVFSNHQCFLLETPPNLEGELNYAGNLTTIASSRARCDFLIFSSFLDDDKSPYDDAQ